MFAGLPWSSWLLLLAAVGIGLAVEIAFWLRHRPRRRFPGRREAPGPEA